MEEPGGGISELNPFSSRRVSGAEQQQTRQQAVKIKKHEGAVHIIDAAQTMLHHSNK